MTLTEDDRDYHAHPALSYSTGKLLLRSPQHYRHALANRKQSTAFDEGHVIHALVLGIGSEVVEIPAELLSGDGGIRSAEARGFRDDVYAAGKIPIKPDQMAPLRAAADAVLAHPTAKAWLQCPGDVEVPLFATDPETGIEIRGKIDKLADLNGRKVPVDLKTMADVLPFKVFSAVRDFDYDLQAAMYRKLIGLALGAKSSPGVLIAVEKKAPYGVAVYQISHEDFIEAGELKLRTILNRAAAIRDNPEAWDGYPLGTQILTPPGYYLTDLAERLES